MVAPIMLTDSRRRSWDGEGPAVERTGPGFSLIELLVVTSLVALLVSLLLPAMDRARRLAIDMACAANLRQIGTAQIAYLSDEDGFYYWRGNQTWVGNAWIAGMDWYIYGGREEGNNPALQGGLFNFLQPRPLNPYLHDHINTFHCPYDSEKWDWAGFEIHFEWVGNSYIFNSYGWPGGPRSGGLAGRHVGAVAQPSETVIFLDASLVRSPGAWHHEEKGNIAFCDGHIAFLGLHDEPMSWNP